MQKKFTTTWLTTDTFLVQSSRIPEKYPQPASYIRWICKSYVQDDHPQSCRNVGNEKIDHVGFYFVEVTRLFRLLERPPLCASQTVVHLLGRINSPYQVKTCF